MQSKSELIAKEVLSNNPSTVVDIGYAQLPNHFLKNVRVFGVDIVKAPSLYEKTFVCDLNKDSLPFKDAEIDVVAMGCTLAHVSNPLKVLGEINRILKDGGALVMSSPNPNYYWENILNIFYNFFKTRVVAAKHEEHFFEFSRYNLRTSANRMGFQVIKEVGVTFQLVKTNLKFNPLNCPGIAYEIIYVLKKIGEPKLYTTFEGSGRIDRIPTVF